VLFQGAGAGSMPTTSAIMADVLEASRSIVRGNRPAPWRYTADMAMKTISQLTTRYYIRVEVSDRPGVLAEIARACGDNNVSIASVLQKETDDEAQTAEIVIMTHAAQEADVQRSISQIERLKGDVRCVGSVLRVED